MTFYKSERDNSNSGEIAEQIRTRRIKGKYYNKHETYVSMSIHCKIKYIISP